MAATIDDNVPSPLKRKAEEEDETNKDVSAGSDHVKKYKPIIMERNEDGTPLKKRVKKSVSFDGVNVFFFPRSQGFTSVPSQGGATLGMSPKHEGFKQFTLAEFAKLQEAAHRNAIKVQLLQRRREQMLRSNCDYQERALEQDVDEEIAQIAIGDYYFLQPVPTKQRRILLRNAGIRKIDRTEKVELKRIRLSRESCGCDCVGYCDPRTCQCSLAGIKCQVDRMSFPCGCTKDYCRNAHGRIEFNPVKVREHFISTMQKLEWEENGGSSENGSSPSDGFSSPERDGQLTLGSESIDPSQSSFSSSSYVFGNPLANNKTFHSDGFHSMEHYQPFPPGSLQPFPSGYSSGISSEREIPIRIEPCQSLNFVPQKLHFNESEDCEGDRNFSMGLPPAPSYDSSEDSLSSSSDASSTSGGDGLSREADPYHFDDGSDFTRTSEESVDYMSRVQGEGCGSPESPKEAPEQSGKTYTELTQSSTLQSFSFSQFPSISHSSVEGQGLPPMGSIFQSLGKSRHEQPMVTLGMLSDISSTLAGGQGARLYSTYSTPTTVNSIEEMNETALATSSISTPPSGFMPFRHSSEMGNNSEMPSMMSQDLVVPHQGYYPNVKDLGNEDNDQEGHDRGSLQKDELEMSASIPVREEGDNAISENSHDGSDEDIDDKESSDDNEPAEDENEASKLSEEERDSSDSSSDSAVFSGTEEPCAANEIDEGAHPLSSDSSNDSGLVPTGESRKLQNEGVVAECDEDSLVEGSTKIPKVFKPVKASDLPNLTTTAAD